MTVSTEDLRISQYVGAGSTGPYTIGFTILDEHDLLVIRSTDSTGVEETLVITTDYTVSTTLDTITLTTALAVGKTLTIKGDTPLLQESDFTDFSKFPAEDVEDALDKLTFIINEQAETVGRGLTLPISTSIASGETTGESAGYILRINEAGTGVEWVAGSSVAVAISDIVVDTSPQLGADLDCNSFNILMDDATGINDDSDNEFIKFSKTASAVNEFTITNTATGNGPILSATGGDSNININLQPKGTGSLQVKGTSTSSAEVRLYEDTDNGTNYTGLKAASSITTSTTFTLPSADSTSGYVLKTDGSGALGFQQPAMEFISATSASAATEVDISLPTGYTYFTLVASGVTVGTDDKDIYVRFRTTGGSIRSGASDYRYSNHGRAAATVLSQSSTGAAQVLCTDTGITGVGNAAGEHFNIYFTISNPRNSSIFTRVGGRFDWVTAGGDIAFHALAGMVNTAESNDLVEILAESSATITGTFILYGFREA